MDFLQSVAQHYLEEKPLKEWQELIFVFPNHRSGVFFSNAITALLAEEEKAGRGHVIFGLNITTIGDLLGKNRSLRVADQVTLRCELYDAYKKVNEADEHRFSFDSFYSWAGAIINDFEDIDKGLANAYGVYRNVTEWQQTSDDMSYISDRQRKAIEDFWHINFDEKETAMGEQLKVHRRFVESYTKMLNLYSLFSNQLRAKGLAYPGMLYRDAAEEVDGCPWDDRSKHYVFIGFSLLSRAEEKIMHRLQKADRATFFWDYDDDMLRDAKDIHSAGYAVAQWAKEFPAPRGYRPPLGVPPQDQRIKIIETAYPQSQTGVAAYELLTGIDQAELTAEEKLAKASRDFRRTVMVLPDEQMLIPMLSIMPADIIKSLNVTMGYELKYTNVSGLAHLMSEAQMKQNQHKNPDGSVSFNNRLVLSVLQQPFVVEIDSAEKTRAMMAKIIRDNAVYIDRHELAELPLTHMVLQVVTPDQMPAYATGVFEKVLNEYAQRENETLNREAIWEALKVSRRMNNVITLVQDDLPDSRLLTQIMCTMIDKQKVNFQGMPLGGLQIMGILETRAIDFDQIIALDMTEGQWPRAQMTDTMIPMVIRRGNGMPTDDEIASSYNYYFHRLKNRAKSLTLIHPAKSDRGTTTASRYIMQLQMLRDSGCGQNGCDPSKCGQGPHIEEVNVQKNVRPRTSGEIKIDKKKLPANWGDALKISPSSLSNYIECSLKFYFDKVLKIGVFDEVQEEADASQLGTIYHDVMEKLYKPHDGHPTLLTEESLKRTAANVDMLKNLIMEEFRVVMKNKKLLREEDLNGRNIITFNVILKMVQKTLETEQPGTAVTATEQKIEMPCTLPSGRKTTLKGTVDRQHWQKDSNGNTIYCVADYKTGQVKKMNIDSIDDLFNAKAHKDNKAIMQVLMYCYMLRREKGLKGKLTPYVLALQKIFTEKDSWQRIATMNKKPIAYGDDENANIPDNDAQDNTARDITAGDADIDNGNVNGAEKETGNESGNVMDGKEFEQKFNARLLAKINEIFDPEVKFEQTEQTTYCPYCDFRYICKREDAK